MRARLRHDVELLEKIPPNTEAREKFETYLSTQVDRFTKYETESSRDVQGLVISTGLVLAFGAVALWLIALDDWYWWLPGAISGLFALVGLTVIYDDAQKVPRNEKGKRL